MNLYFINSALRTLFATALIHDAVFNLHDL